MLNFLCFLAWMVALYSDDNQSTILTFLCFFAFVNSIGV